MTEPGRWNMQPVSMPKNGYPAFWRPAPQGPPSLARRLGQQAAQQMAPAVRPAPFIDSPFMNALTSGTASLASLLYGLSLRRELMPLKILSYVAATATGLTALVQVFRIGVRR